MVTDIGDIITLRHMLHQHPELSMQEAWTKKTLLEFIRERTHAKIVDMGGWFCCIFGAGKQGPGIAFRAEMDGLTQPASEGLTLRFSGKPSHASKPEQGANPSGAIAKTVLYMEELLNREHTGMILGTVVGMSAGTGDFGISAGEGELKITLRAENEEDMLRLEKDICSHALFRAEQDGLKMTYRISDYFPETRNGRAALEKVRQTAAELGMDVIDMPNLWRASEDFGYYTKVMEGAIFYIGTGEQHAGLHTSAYDFNDGIIPTAVDIMYRLAVSPAIYR